VTDLYRRPEVIALLADAKQRPEDEGPRLVLADWLDEDGDPDRAEFIRLQCGLAPWAALQGDPTTREKAEARTEDLLARLGGGWLGPLWTEGGRWHRGLIAARLNRRWPPERLQDALPWLDTVVFEITGRDAFRNAVAVLAAGRFNHAGFALRRPFAEERLLSMLGEILESTCLRTLTLWLPPGMARRVRRQVVPAFGVAFFARLASELPVGRHLTHLGTGLALTTAQVQPLHAAGIEVVRATSPFWMHAVPPAWFASRPLR
jgi:uncharacterized protein (TIGR02996 family)